LAIFTPFNILANNIFPLKQALVVQGECMDITQHGKHIFMYVNEDNLPCLTTDDYELFDVMDDYLTEDCDYDFECSHFHDSFAKGHFTMEIESGISFAELITSVKKFDLDEIERIYKINNA
jgi:hypothetical protein